jgi:hypothetical protein
MRPLKLVPLFALVGSLAGCEMHAGWDYDVEPTDPGSYPAEVTQESIAADAKLSAKPGDGVGIFIEYGTGGHWNVFTTCDYSTPSNAGYACAFDVYATLVGASGRLFNAQGNDLQGFDDTLSVDYDGSLHLYTENKLALSGMSFDAPVGAIVEFDVYVDGVEDPHFIYWVGDFGGQQVLHSGAPSDPLDLAPNEPAAASHTGGMGM